MKSFSPVPQETSSASKPSWISRSCSRLALTFNSLALLSFGMYLFALTLADKAIRWPFLHLPFQSVLTLERYLHNGFVRDISVLEGILSLLGLIFSTLRLVLSPHVPWVSREKRFFFIGLVLSTSILVFSALVLFIYMVFAGHGPFPS